jgi:hypothetical protein
VWVAAHPAVSRNGGPRRLMGSDPRISFRGGRSAGTGAAPDRPE